MFFYEVKVVTQGAKIVHANTASNHNLHICNNAKT
jgi:hypothetical protein